MMKEKRVEIVINNTDSFFSQKTDEQDKFSNHMMLYSDTDYWGSFPWTLKMQEGRYRCL